jgi:hypothetical protein
MTDDQILEMAKQLYGGPVSEEALRNHKTIAFARLIEKQVKEEGARIVLEIPTPRDRNELAAAIRKGK